MTLPSTADQLNMGAKTNTNIMVPYIRVILGLYRDNGKENGNYCLGFRA